MQKEKLWIIRQKLKIMIFFWIKICYNTGNDKLREEALWILKL